MASAYKGYQQLTSLGSAVALTVPADANLAVIQAEGQTVRYLLDGTNPTASTGGRIIKDSQIPTQIRVVDGLKVAKFIEESASAKLNVLYFGPETA